MSDWIGLAIILLIIACGLLAAARLGTPPERISQEEFERRVREGARTRAAMFALQQWLNPKAAQAAEVQQDLKHGYYNKKKIPGEGDGEAEPTAGKSSSSDIEERDA
ncbi:MAG TPA: hypothetical protein VF527_14610 [Pyrinomonadaceae bacterium]|jgi:hypothetical protein